MSTEERSFPSKTNLNFVACRVVVSKKTQEQLIVIDVETKTRQVFSVWLRKDDVKQMLSEITELI
jgi:hypothetical protein